MNYNNCCFRFIHKGWKKKLNHPTGRKNDDENLKSSTRMERKEKQVMLIGKHFNKKIFVYWIIIIVVSDLFTKDGRKNLTIHQEEKNDD